MIIKKVWKVKKKLWKILENIVDKWIKNEQNIKKSNK